MSAGPHPVDLLIRALVDTGRDATSAETVAIVARIAAAPLSDHIMKTPSKERGRSHAGIVITARMRADEYHLVKRVDIEKQWAVTTTMMNYRDDLHRAANTPAARIAVYERRGGYLAATLIPTSVVMLPSQLGPGTRPLFVVVYSADRGTIITGYQAASLSEIAIPGDALWLR